MSAERYAECEDCQAGAPLQIAGIGCSYRCESCGHGFKPSEAIHGPDGDGVVWHHDSARCIYLQARDKNQTPFEFLAEIRGRR